MTDVALRPTTDEDLPLLFEHQSDPEAAAMAAFPSRDRQAFDAHQARIRADPDVITRTIVADGAVVGAIGSFTVGDQRDVGYWIDRGRWGEGIATAALRAFLEVDRTRPLFAHVAVDNVGSRRVLEKCGFRHVRTTPPGPDGVREDVMRRDAPGEG